MRIQEVILQKGIIMEGQSEFRTLGYMLQIIGPDQENLNRKILAVTLL